jgi:hypothetical protein
MALEPHARALVEQARRLERPAAPGARARVWAEL